MKTTFEQLQDAYDRTSEEIAGLMDRQDTLDLAMTKIEVEGRASTGSDTGNTLDYLINHARKPSRGLKPG